MVKSAFFWLLLCLGGLVASQTCYWPSGEKAAEDWLACPNSKHCCHETEACFSNGLCFGAKHMTLYRGACTDQAWMTPDCPRICHDKIDSKWANLFRCSKNESLFACGTLGRNHVCNNQLGHYKWVSANVTEAQVMRSSASTSTPGATSTAGGPTGGSTASSTPTKKASSNDTTPRDIGLGVGLGVPFLLAVIGLCWFYTHTQRQIRSLQLQLLEQSIIDEKSGRIPGTPSNIPRELDNASPNPPELYPNTRSELA